MLKSDNWISQQSKDNNLISPFSERLISKTDNTKTHPLLSYGLSSYGYDVRLSPFDFAVFKRSHHEIIDPKRFSRNAIVSQEIQLDSTGDRFFVVPAHGFALGVSLEKIAMPRNVTAMCLNKSTYARCGLDCTTTVLEAGWTGHITLEFANHSSSDLKVYAYEGIVQLLFFESENCDVAYCDRNGKYQNQPQQIVFPKC